MKQLPEPASVNAQVLASLRTAVITGELAPGSLYSVQTLFEQDHRFHRPFLEASGNSRLARLVDGLQDMVYT